MKVAYLTHETLGSGLFISQVVDYIDTLSDMGDINSIDLVVFNYPWIVLKAWFYPDPRIKQLKKKGVRVKLVPLLVPVKFGIKYLSYQFFISSWLSLVTFLSLPRRVDIVHCRGYLMTNCVLNVFRGNVVFDLRSLWVMESLSAGTLKPNTSLEKYWNELEKRCIAHSSAAVVVSKGMLEYINDNFNKKLVAEIPIGVDSNSYAFSLEMRNSLRGRFGWQDKLVFIYSGSLGLASINKKTLQNLFKNIHAEFPTCAVLFLTAEPMHIIEDLLSNSGFSRESYQVKCAQGRELGDYMSAGDIGIHALPAQLDSSTRLGTKVIEYWANGLPALVNENVGAAAMLIENHHLGFIAYNNRIPLSIIETVNKNGIQGVRKDFLDTTSQITQNKFSWRVVSERYFHLYQQVADGAL